MLQEVFEKMPEEGEEKQEIVGQVGQDQESQGEQQFQDSGERRFMTAEEIIEKKRNAIESYYDAIVVMKDRKRVYKDILIANKIIRALKKSILDGRITSKDMIEIEKKYYRLAENIWNNLSLISPEAPLLGVYQVKEWRKLNDNFSTKQKLIQRKNTIVIVPGSEVIGMLSIVLKYFRIITNRFSTFPEQKSIEMIAQLKNLYEVLKTELKKLNNYVIEEYNIIIRKGRFPIILGKREKKEEKETSREDKAMEMETEMDMQNKNDNESNKEIREEVEVTEEKVSFNNIN